VATAVFLGRATPLAILPRRRKSWSLPSDHHSLLPRNRHDRSPPVTLLSLRPPRVFSKLATTTDGTYKLPPQWAPLSNHTPNALARASDCPPESCNLEFPPNQSRTPSCVSSPWPALYRSVHALLALVSIRLCAVDAHRPNQLNWTWVDHREHLGLSSICAITMDREFSTRNCAICWGIRVARARIRCRTKEGPSRCVFRLVRVHRRRARRRPLSWTWRCEEIEVRGSWCKCQWDKEIVLRTL
jgi:hypothetical protein